MDLVARHATAVRRLLGEYGALWLTDCIVRLTLDGRHEAASIAEQIAVEYRRC